MAEDKVAAEVAEREFDRFLDAMGLTEKTQAKTLDAEDRKSFEDAKSDILRAMRNGSLVIDDRGCPVFTPLMDEGDPKPIVFKEPRGRQLKAADQAKKGHDVERGYFLMSAITGQVRARFEDMAHRDLVVCRALTALFLA